MHVIPDVCTTNDLEMALVINVQYTVDDVARAEADGEPLSVKSDDEKQKVPNVWDLHLFREFLTISCLAS